MFSVFGHVTREDMPAAHPISATVRNPKCSPRRVKNGFLEPNLIILSPGHKKNPSKLTYGLVHFHSTLDAGCHALLTEPVLILESAHPALRGLKRLNRPSV